MKVLIAIVSYRTPDLTKRYYELLRRQEKSLSSDYLDVVVLINGGLLGYDLNQIGMINYRVVDNEGYYGTFISFINHNDVSHYDYVILSNPDIHSIDGRLFDYLREHRNSTTGIIGPAILSLRKKTNRNPSSITKPSLAKMKIQVIIRSHQMLSILLDLYSARLRWPAIVNKSEVKSVYMVHGSFVIISKQLIPLLPKKALTFLYCEEFIFSETALKNNLKVIYDSRLTVYDYENISTGVIKNKKINAYWKQSLLTIIHEYF